MRRGWPPTSFFQTHGTAGSDEYRVLSMSEYISAVSSPGEPRQVQFLNMADLRILPRGWCPYIAHNWPRCNPACSQGCTILLLNMSVHISGVSCPRHPQRSWFSGIMYVNILSREWYPQIVDIPHWFNTVSAWASTIPLKFIMCSGSLLTNMKVQYCHVHTKVFPAWRESHLQQNPALNN